MSRPSEPFTCEAHHAGFKVIDHDDSIDVTITGEIDLSSADASRLVLEHVGELLGATPRTLRVDLAVSFFDAAGIRLLLQLERLADLCSTTSIVKNAPQDVRRLLDIVGLQRMLKEP